MVRSSWSAALVGFCELTGGRQDRRSKVYLKIVISFSLSRTRVCAAFGGYTMVIVKALDTRTVCNALGGRNV